MLNLESGIWNLEYTMSAVILSDRQGAKNLLPAWPTPGRFFGAAAPQNDSGDLPPGRFFGAATPQNDT